jgi:O-antigen biosynthesis protein
MKDISIIIVNYNVKEYIIPCIESIYRYSLIKLRIEIIIVDNNSHDGSVELIKNKFPKIKLIKNINNEGFSKGINKGIKIAKGKYYYILNPDTYLLNDALSILFAFMEKNKNISATGTAILNSSNNIQQSAWKKPSILNVCLSLFHLDYLNINKNYNLSYLKKATKVETISGASFFVRSKTFDSLNGFDSNLFWMEDIDYCLRSSLKGYKTFYLPTAKIFHHKSKSSEKNWPITIQNQLLSKIKYFIKHHSKKEVFILKISIFIISTLKIIIFLLISPLQKKYQKKLIGHILVLQNIVVNDY